MKIDDRMIQYEIGKQLPNSTPEEAGKVTKKDVSDVSSPRDSDSSRKGTVVHHSSEWREAKRIEEAIAAAPDVREEKVAELKARIESGEYRIDHDAIADKLIDAFLDDLI